MAIGRDGAALRQLRTLFDAGTLVGLTDGQLLERFATRPPEAAEAAFAALVERHGPMVLRACRGVLADPHDAQDAFQATFLVLVRKARGLWVRDSLGPWLHQVAYRTACGARSDAIRRRRHERRAAEKVAARREGEGEGGYGLVEGCERALHEEIARLPRRYRAAVVLCDLEGCTHEQAARHLGCPVGTVKSRLARGRERLRDRLARRGLAPGAIVLGNALAGPVRAAVPAVLEEATIRLTTAGPAIATEVVSAAAAAMAGGVLRTMFMTKLRLAVVAALAPVVVWGIIALQAPGSQDSDEQTAQDTRNEPLPRLHRGQVPNRDRPALVAPRALNVRSGGGTTTVFALDWNGERVPQRPDDPKSPLKEVDLELHWVVLSGILDHRTIRENYTKALRVDPSRAHPEYRRVEVERQGRMPGGEWSDWASVDHDRNRLVLENIPEAEEELAPETVLIRPALVDDLPLLKGGQYWTGAHIAALVPRGKRDSHRKEPPMPRHPGDGDFPRTEAPEVLVRSLDFTVEPGMAYRYRARIVAESPLLQGQRRELIGPWSVPTAEVLVPAS